MTLKTPLVPALAAILLVPLAAHAAPTAAASSDPCANASQLTTRDQILAAIKPGDQNWAEALGRRGIHKQADGGWMQYFQGGTMTASNPAFVRAFEDYCTERVRTAQRAISAAASKPRPDTRPQAVAAQQMVSYTETTAKKQADVAQKAVSVTQRIKALFASDNEGKEVAASMPATPDAAQCQQWKDLAESCEGNINTESPSGYGLGSEARCHRAVQNYKKCPQ
jgi:hypothetical protein